LEDNNITDKLPEELGANYRANRKGSPIVERLKVAAALKLWGDRGYRDVRFGCRWLLVQKQFSLRF
jgi:hypothetical protein